MRKERRKREKKKAGAYAYKVRKRIEKEKAEGGKVPQICIEGKTEKGRCKGQRRTKWKG